MWFALGTALLNVRLQHRVYLALVHTDANFLGRCPKQEVTWRLWREYEPKGRGEKRRHGSDR